MEGRFQENSINEVKQKYADDFDFEKMNKKIVELFKGAETKVDVESKYNKTISFFDNISRSKEENSETPYDKHKQREIDNATFDFDLQYREKRGGYNPRYRRGWRGRYRQGQRGYGRRPQQSYYRRRG